MEKEDKSVLLTYLIILIQKIIVLGCFTALAIIFNKWWIIFFSLLFWPSGKVESTECKKK